MDRAAAERIFVPAARAALAQFAVRYRRLDFVHLSENVTFRVEAEHGPNLALRLHRPGYQSIGSLISERQWTRALREVGVVVPTPILTHDDQDYVAVDIPGLGETRWASLGTWLDGRMLVEAIEAESEREPAVARFFQLGETLARAHALSSRWDPPRQFTRPRLDADGLMGPAPVWGPFWRYHTLTDAESRLLLETRDRIHSALVRLGERPEIFGMIHADMHPGNVIATPGQLALIDFDDAAFGWYMYDLAVALGLYQAHPDYAAFHQACIGGYRSVRALSETDLALVPMFVLARGMAQLGWLQARPEVAEPPQLAGLKDWVCLEAGRLKLPL